MEKMPKIVLPISLQFDISNDWNLLQNKPCVLILLMPTDFLCQPKKWADMGTFNTEWKGYYFSDFVGRLSILSLHFYQSFFSRDWWIQRCKNAGCQNLITWAWGECNKFQ